MKKNKLDEFILIQVYKHKRRKLMRRLLDNVKNLLFNIFSFHCKNK